MFTCTGISWHLIPKLYNVAWSVYFGFYRGSLLPGVLKILKCIWGYQFSYPKNSLGKKSEVRLLGSDFQPDRMTIIGAVLSNSQSAFTAISSSDSPHNSYADIEAAAQRGWVICLKSHSKGRAGNEPQSSGLSLPKALLLHLWWKRARMVLAPGPTVWQWVW